MIGGAEVDTSALAADRDALFKFIREFTNHPELKFGKVINTSEFRYALPTFSTSICFLPRR